MSNEKIYCNVTECFFNKPLAETHTKKRRPGFTPLVDSMDEYVGSCARDGIQVAYGEFRSPSKRIQRVAYCQSYDTGKYIKYVKSTDDYTTWTDLSGDEVFVMGCSVYNCAFNTASKKGEVGGCRKVDEDKPIYVDLYKVYDDNEEFMVARCSSHSNRRFEGHIDWAKAANPTMGSYKAFPKPERPSIRGSW